MGRCGLFSVNIFFVVFVYLNIHFNISILLFQVGHARFLLPDTIRKCEDYEILTFQDFSRKYKY